MSAHRTRTHTAATVGLAVLLGLLLPMLGAGRGSAAHLQVDGGVLQVFAFDGPARALRRCGDLDGYDGILHGAAGDDVLRAGNHPQIIMGHGGDDILYGGNQHDCLIGGSGDDTLHSGNGKDILVGGEGDDVLDGGTGKDILDIRCRRRAYEGGCVRRPNVGLPASSGQG